MSFPVIRCLAENSGRANIRDSLKLTSGITNKELANPVSFLIWEQISAWQWGCPENAGGCSEGPFNVEGLGGLYRASIHISYSLRSTAHRMLVRHRTLEPSTSSARRC